MKKNRITKENITKLTKNQIFVFGSNADGNHAGGAARIAVDKFGAIQGNGFGLQGKSYAINTMSGLESIKQGVEKFIDYAKNNSELVFLVTELGCGIAGFKPSQIAPFFELAKDIENIHLPKSFWDILNVKKIVGYKAFDINMKCRGFQFEVGKTFTYDKEPILCNQGFHFCEKITDCFSYYDFDKTKTIICAVEASDLITKKESGCSKRATNTLKILNQLDWSAVVELSNLGKDCTGHSNSGDRNSGNSNSGNRNSGDRNSGNSNSGNRNSGNWNSGDRNSGNSNSGNWNSGNSNSGNSNSGNWNSGDWNSGDWNSGDRNSGNWNSGDWNSGDWNSGDRNSGFFNVDQPKTIRVFGKDVNRDDWDNCYKPSFLYFDINVWVCFSDMTEQEKIDHPKAFVCEGYLKRLDYKEAFKKSWDNANKEDRIKIKNIPGFDAQMFFEISGIKINKND